MWTVLLKLREQCLISAVQLIVFECIPPPWRPWLINEEAKEIAVLMVATQKAALSGWQQVFFPYSVGVQIVG